MRGKRVMLVLGCPWFVLVSSAPGDRRACVVRARGWRARQAAGQAKPSHPRPFAGSCGACLLAARCVCVSLLVSGVRVDVCMYVCTMYDVLCALVDGYLLQVPRRERHVA